MKIMNLNNLNEKEQNNIKAISKIKERKINVEELKNFLNDMFGITVKKIGKESYIIEKDGMIGKGATLIEAYKNLQ